MANSWDSTVGTDEYNSTLKRSEEIASSRNYRLNDDMERLEKVVGLMTMNYMEFGEYFCPCKQNHPLDQSKDPICPCVELEEEIKKDGQCFCRLFYKQHGID